jgi:hypothetical protein
MTVHATPFLSSLCPYVANLAASTITNFLIEVGTPNSDGSYTTLDTYKNLMPGYTANCMAW